MAISSPLAEESRPVSQHHLRQIVLPLYKLVARALKTSLRASLTRYKLHHTCNSQANGGRRTVHDERINTTARLYVRSAGTSIKPTVFKYATDDSTKLNQRSA